MLYPLSYEGGPTKVTGETPSDRADWTTAWLIP